MCSKMNPTRSRWASNDKACAARRMRAHEGTKNITAMYFLHYTTHKK